MPKKEKLRRSEKRKHPRADLSVKVTLYPVSEGANGLEVHDLGFEAKSCDISEGGINLELSDTDSLADILKIKIKMKKNYVEMFAELVWQKNGNCGFQCIVLSDVDRAQISDYVQSRKKLSALSYSRKENGGRPRGSKNGGKVSWSK